MKRNAFQFAALAAVSTLGGVNASAQSVDALLNKLVEKGTLTLQEANELKKESNDGFTKGYQARSGMPDWVTALKLNGDFRRLRFGAVATIKDNFEVGLRLTSSESGAFGGDPISGNTTFQDNASRKFVFIDLAYAKWKFLDTQPFSASVAIGKIENPFVVSENIFDPDYDPEGAGATFAYRLNDQHTLKLNAGAFALDELSGSHNDPWLYGAQVRWDAAWSKQVATTVGLTGLNIVDDRSLTNNAVPNGQRGNTRDPGTGVLSHHFNPIVVDAAATYSFGEIPIYKGPFPVKVAGEYVNNLAADNRAQAWQAGVTFGKAGKKGQWELSYRYKYLGGDSWYEEFTDSDFGAFYQGTFPNSGLGAGYGAGTNVRGHHCRAIYSFYDSFSLSVAYGRTILINEFPAGSDSGMTRLTVDAMWRF